MTHYQHNINLPSLNILYLYVRLLMIFDVDDNKQILILICGFRNPCTLNAFVSDYIKDTFVLRQHKKLAAKVEVVTKCQEAWKVPIAPEQAAERGLPRPLLQVSSLSP